MAIATAIAIVDDIEAIWYFQNCCAAALSAPRRGRRPRREAAALGRGVPMPMVPSKERSRFGEEENDDATPPRKNKTPAAPSATKAPAAHRVWSKQSLKKDEWVRYSFNEEMLVPVRHSKGGKMDTGLPVDVLTLQGTSDTEEISGEFTDGTVHKLGITAGEIKEKARINKCHGDATLWQTEHRVTKHAITIRQRSDRTLLMSMYEQKQQLLMVRVDFFGFTDGATDFLPHDHEAVQGALAFMKSIAEKYARNELTKDQLVTERNQRVTRIKKMRDEENGNAKQKKRRNAAAAKAKAKPEPPIVTQVTATEKKPAAATRPSKKAKKNPEGAADQAAQQALNRKVSDA